MEMIFSIRNPDKPGILISIFCDFHLVTVWIKHFQATLYLLQP